MKKIQLTSWGGEKEGESHRLRHETGEEVNRLHLYKGERKLFQTFIYTEKREGGGEKKGGWLLMVSEGKNHPGLVLPGGSNEVRVICRRKRGKGKGRQIAGLVCRGCGSRPNCQLGAGKKDS